MPVPKEIGHQVTFGKSLYGYFLKGCWQIPEVMGASFMALIGIGLALAGMRNYAKNDGDKREYHQVYMIMRHTDPRQCSLKNPVYTEFKGK